MEILEMEKGSNFVEILAGFRGWYGWDRSAATINSELFPLKTEAQAMRYGFFYASSFPDNPISAEIESDSAENEPKQLREQPRSNQRQLRLS